MQLTGIDDEDSLHSSSIEVHLLEGADAPVQLTSSRVLRCVSTEEPENRACFRPYPVGPVWISCDSDVPRKVAWSHPTMRCPICCLEPYIIVDYNPSDTGSRQSDQKLFVSFYVNFRLCRKGAWHSQYQQNQGGNGHLMLYK